jgi:hypothetical protein
MPVYERRMTLYHTLLYYIFEAFRYSLTPRTKNALAACRRQIVTRLSASLPLFSHRTECPPSHARTPHALLLHLVVLEVSWRADYAPAVSGDLVAGAR